MSQPFTVVALIAARNENDIIGQVIEHLVQQGVQIYFIDDGSTDGTAETVERWKGRGGVIGIERRTDSGAFEWGAILSRKEELAAEIDAAWFIHHDADEFRQSPFPGKSLSEAFRLVDDLGYNAVDFKVLNFRLTAVDESDAARDVRSALRYYEPAEYWETPQIKAWKKTSRVDLTSSGGHEAVFDDRQVFPAQFLVRHYPVRSQKQGERKVFQDRQPRFLPSERAAGWHVQYNALAPGHNFLRDPATLTPFDEATVLSSLRVRHRATPALEAAEARIAELSAQVGREPELEQRLLASQTQLKETRELMEIERTNAQRERAAAARLRESEHLAFEQVAAGLRQHADNLRAMFVEAGRTATDQLEHQAAQTQALKNDLSKLYSSRSWRVTAPLRWGLDLVTRKSQASERSELTESPSYINWGQLATVQPLSNVWGTDRGRPIDRYFIEGFLGRHAADISGVVCEVKDPGYTRMFGGSRVTESIVIDVESTNALATLHGDLTQPTQFPSDVADCFILTQTIHIIYDYERALHTALQMLKPGGVLLCTVPALSRVNYENGGLESGDYWRFTAAAIKRAFSGLGEAKAFEVETFGNVRTCAAFLYGLASEDMPQAVLDFNDPWFPLVHCIRAVKE